MKRLKLNSATHFCISHTGKFHFSIVFLYTVPGSPANVNVTTLNQSTLTLQWNRPLTPNGVITMYRYTCAQLGARGEGGGGDYGEKPKLVGNTTETAAIVTGLTPYTSYECTVYASTKIGEGPGASSVGTTADDSELVIL